MAHGYGVGAGVFLDDQHRASVGRGRRKFLARLARGPQSREARRKALGKAIGIAAGHAHDQAILGEQVGVAAADVGEGNGFQAGDRAGGRMAVGMAIGHERGQSLFAQVLVVVSAQGFGDVVEGILTKAGEIFLGETRGQDLLGQ